MSISLSPHLLSRSQELLFCRKGRRKGTQDMLSLRFRTSRRPCGRLVPTFILSGGLIFYCKTTLTSYKPINQVTRHSLLYMHIEFLPQNSGPPPLRCNICDQASCVCSVEYSPFILVLAINIFHFEAAFDDRRMKAQDDSHMESLVIYTKYFQCTCKVRKNCNIRW